MSKKPGKRRWSLTLLYSTAFFLIQLAAVLITAALSFLLTKLGVLDNLGIPRNSGFAMLIVMLLMGNVTFFLLDRLLQRDLLRRGRR